MEGAKPDQRREAGQRTRERLMDAALALLAQRGEQSVTLRAIIKRAKANVAAVSYHFGSLSSLCNAAVERALERYLDAQYKELRALGPKPTVEQVAAAFAGPTIRALSGGGPDLAVRRIVARAAIDPPEGWSRLAATFEQIRADVLRALRGTLPGITDRELVFRIRCVAGLLNWIVLAPVGSEVRGKLEKQIERLVVPPLVGIFRGGA
jgi:AcrR family transcriptional regulator